MVVREMGMKTGGPGGSVGGMPKTISLSIVLALGLAVVGLRCSDARAGTKSDIEYSHPDGVSLKLDAYVPEDSAAGAGGHPVVIVVHGGGWNSGSKTGDTMPVVKPLEEGGFVVFSIDYRLAPAHRWPACFDDLKAAVRWARAHAGEYHGDPSKIALLGYSAGGQLVTLYAAEAKDADQVQAVVGIAPPTDFEQDLPQRGGLSKSLQDLLDRPKEVTDESRKMIRDMSAIHHVHPGLPPFLIVQGSADKTVPPVQSKHFVAKLKEANVPCELVIVEGAPHRLSTWPKYDKDYAEKIVGWLQRTLGSAPTTQPAAGGSAE